MRLTWSLVFGLALVWAGAACGPEDDELRRTDGVGEVEAPPGGEVPTEAEAPKPEPPGVVRGIIRSTQTGDPVEGALIAVGDLGTTTDASGSYTVPLLPPGPITVLAYRRGFRPESTEVVVGAGRWTVADLSLDFAAPPCCGLDGDWSARFVLDSAGLNARPSARTLEGRLSLTADAGDDYTVESSARVVRSSGTADLDFGPLLGFDVGDVGDFEGMAFSDDSVTMTLFPRFGDWAIELRGLQSADSIRGRWFQRASCCGAYGSFVLTRDDPSGGGRGSG